MGTGLLNRVCGEELKQLVIDVIRERNNGKDNPVGSTIQTIIEMRGYFVTQSDLYNMLGEMRKSKTIIAASQNFEGYHYQLNHEPTGEAIQDAS